MLCTTKGIGAFWALQADALDKGRMNRMVAHLADTAEFDQAKDDPMFVTALVPNVVDSVIPGGGLDKAGIQTVSYTHLDVYKRQGHNRITISADRNKTTIKERNINS